MNRLALIAGLLAVSIFAGLIISAQYGSITVPFLLQRRVVINPSAYLTNLTLYAGQAGSLRLNNIMQFTVYVSQASLNTTTLAVNTTRLFLSLNFTLFFNSLQFKFNGLTNGTTAIPLTQGTYTLSVQIDYTTQANIPSAQTATEKIIFS